MTLPAFTMSNFIVSRKRLAFLCAAVSVAALAVFFTWAGNQGLLAVAGQDNQRFSELYFTDSEAIPTDVVAGRQYTVPFALVNHEDVTKQYSYRITIEQDGHKEQRPIERLTLRNDERAVRHLRFNAPEGSGVVTVSVKLQSSGQTISFRVEPAQ